MNRTLVLLLVAFVATAGSARGGDRTFAIVQGDAPLPGSALANVGDLGLAPMWMAPPIEPARLSYAELLTLWQEAGQAYGVPWSVLAAINKVESNFGRNMGPSSAGAIGWMQFMPSTWLRWGTDADGNGIADPWNPVDAVYSAARYLAASGAASDISQAVFSYNHAWWYVNEVMQLAQLYGSSNGEPADFPNDQTVVALDQLQTRIGEATAAVMQASEAYRDALEHAQALAAREHELVARAESERLLSDQLEGQKQAGLAGAVTAEAQAKADDLKRELDAAQAALARLQAEAQGASFNRSAGQVLGAAPAPDGGYVFPVGGGPSVVSVSHFHHDYPAADIAAPEGSPLYALAGGTVLYVWSWDQRCGNGFTFRAADGQVWTYCHLSYTYPSVQPGAELHAGDPVGLVGSTGDATGPHLHLQLQPAASYPQAQPWFQAFAGTAFHWTDEAPATPAGPRIFHIVADGA